MAKRRRRRYHWLPVIGTASPFEGEAASSLQLGTFTVQATPNGDFFGRIHTAIFPIVNDVPQIDRDLQANGATSEGLGELVGNEYVIERIVGKIWVGYTSPGITSGISAVICKAGIFVARADSVADNVPIGEPINQSQNYSPLAAVNATEPWMWQRSWMLSGTGDTNNPFSSSLQDTKSNYSNRTPMDGPHVDVKSVRRVRQDERLFLAISVVGVEPRADATTSTTGILDFVTDLRVLGALRRAKGGGAF